MRIPTYKNLSELLDDLRLMKEQNHNDILEFYPIQPVRVGSKIGFVNWETCDLECLPIFDEYDRSFKSYRDCICVRKGQEWGVLNTYFRYELPVAYPYSVANQVCKVIEMQDVQSSSIRKYGTYMQFS